MKLKVVEHMLLKVLDIFVFIRLPCRLSGHLRSHLAHKLLFSTC